MRVHSFRLVAVSAALVLVACGSDTAAIRNASVVVSRVTPMPPKPSRAARWLRIRRCALPR